MQEPQLKLAMYNYLVNTIIKNYKNRLITKCLIQNDNKRI